jgi:nucleotide-binding universal stress UspA family protein
VAIIPSEIVGSRSGVVVGIDDSPTSPTVAWFAAAEAARRGEPLRVVHAWIAPTGWGNGVVLDDELVADIEESHRQTVDAAVYRITADFPGLDVTGFTVRGLASRKLFHSDPAPALVVVGSRAHTNFPIVRLGSVTYNVLLNLDAPTIVVRTPIETEHRSGQSSRLVSQR